MSIMIVKDGTTILELCMIEDTYYAVDKNGCHRPISAEQFEAIVSRAEERGCEIFDC